MSSVFNAQARIGSVRAGRGVVPLAARSVFHQAGEVGGVWQVVRGVLRLDRPVQKSGVRQFAGLALSGDLIGGESLVLGHYGFTVEAVVPSELVRWQPEAGTPAQAALLQALMQQQLRSPDIMALRQGSALDRLSALMSILEDHAPSHGRILPSLKEMAELTALTAETVSRTIHEMQKAHGLALDPPRGVTGMERLRRFQWRPVMAGRLMSMAC